MDGLGLDFDHCMDISCSTKRSRSPNGHSVRYETLVAETLDKFFHGTGTVLTYYIDFSPEKMVKKVVAIPM